MNFGCIQHSSSKLDSAFICTKFHFYHLSINLFSPLFSPLFSLLSPLSSLLSYLAIDLASSSVGRSSSVNCLRNVMVMSFSS